HRGGLHGQRLPVRSAGARHRHQRSLPVQPGPHRGDTVMSRRRRHRGGWTRRAFLGGAGALIALPFMESLGGKKAWAQNTAVPLRHFYFYVPNGMHMPEWTPDGTGRDFAVKRILQPIADAGLLDDVLIISNLANRPAEPDGPGDHAAGTGGFLTGKHVRKTEGDNIENGISIDQVVANHIGAGTRIPS